ncbi:MAG: hypothetical protein VZQ83_01640 [Eubacterium sp.]|nr:hypothetical protein [Eubacterium sp.]
MKKMLKQVAAFALVLSLALSLSAVPAEAKSVKGVVSPQVVFADEGGGGTALTSWNVPNIFSIDFDSYRVSADIYIPVSAFKDDGGSFFIDPRVQFWFADLSVNGYLENDVTVRVGYDFEHKTGFYKGLQRGTDEEIEELSYVKNIEEIDDMIRVEIVDAPVNPAFKKDDYNPDTGFMYEWDDPIPATGDACPQFMVGSDRVRDFKYAVANASIKIGDTEYKTDYSKKEEIAGFNDNAGEFSMLFASSFNTTALTVAKTSVKVKKKKSTTVKVTTMFSGDKVSVSSSSKKIAKATYKNGKVTIKGVKKGKATVTVKANGKTKKIKVTVKK